MNEINTSNLNLDGRFILTHIRDGEILDEFSIHNIITDAGKTEVAGLMLTDVGGTAFDYLEIGSGNTAETTSDTALEYPISRMAASGTRTTISSTNDTAQLQITFTNGTGSNWPVTEAGVFNASSAGTMLARKTFDVLNIADGDSLQLTYQVRVG